MLLLRCPSAAAGINAAFMEAARQLMEQKKFGRYEILRELGRGGMATVYLARDPRFDRQVAIKVLPRELMHDPQFRARFEREAKIIAMLEHPFIVPVYDFGDEDGQPYFVMRYIPGGSLADRLREGAFSLAETVRVMRVLCAALDEAHRKNVIHRDLKPGNILFDRSGELCVSDFGIAKITEAQTTMTSGAMLGTPAYMSPEQAQGEAVDNRSDIYSLGVILFEMLTGRQPYTADTPMGVVVKRLTEPLPHILEYCPDLPPGLQTVIEKTMAKDRRERFQTVMEFAAALEAAAQGMPPEKILQAASATIAAPPALPRTPQPSAAATEPTAVSAAAAARRVKSNRVWWAVGALALFLLGALAAGRFLLGNRPSAMVASPSPSPASPPTSLTSPTPAASPTPTLPPSSPTADLLSLTPSPAAMPAKVVIGGADLIAFVSGSDIWFMPVDGSAPPQQATVDRRAKANLQWLPEGKTLLYTSGASIRTVNIETQVEDIFMSFPSAQYLDDFRVSPDGKWAAISLNRELFVIPFDANILREVDRKSELLALDYCVYLEKPAVKQVRWSADSRRLALEFLTPSGSRVSEAIRVIDISACRETEPSRVGVEFPGDFFEFGGIFSFSWDGVSLFLFHSSVRNDGFGKAGFFNHETRKFQSIAPIENACCYRDLTWSPDGKYVAFAFQDIRLGAASPIQLYYVDYAALTTGGALTPLPLPEGFFPNPREQVNIALRPAQP